MSKIQQEAIEYPEGLTQRDHLAHDMRIGRFPGRSEIPVFLQERANAARAQGAEVVPVGWTDAFSLRMLPQRNVINAMIYKREPEGGEAIALYSNPPAPQPTDREKVLEDALRPFAECADLIETDVDDEEWAKFRLVVKDYRIARAALAGGEA